MKGRDAGSQVGDELGMRRILNRSEGKVGRKGQGRQKKEKEPDLKGTVT
jgi:hypothetical protein